MTLPAGITSFIVDRPLCRKCLAAAARTDEAMVKVALAAIGSAVGVVMAADRCRGCLRFTDTYTVPGRN